MGALKIMGAVSNERRLWTWKGAYERKAHPAGDSRRMDEKPPGEFIRICLSAYEGRNLADVRTWFPGDDGKLKPGKGFAAEVKTLAASGGGTCQG